jgi:hypothetical protein
MQLNYSRKQGRQMLEASRGSRCKASFVEDKTKLIEKPSNAVLYTHLQKQVTQWTRSMLTDTKHIAKGTGNKNIKCGDLPEGSSSVIQARICKQGGGLLPWELVGTNLTKSADTDSSGC